MSAEISDYFIRPLDKSDRNWVAQFMDKHWGSTKIVSRGKVHYGHLMPGFVAITGTPEEPGDKIGLITYRLEEDECEIITMNSLLPRHGVASALVKAVKEVVTQAGVKRLWLITTNDNLIALRFYQKRGFALVAVYPDALAESRKLKPQIPIIGLDGIPLRDEIELRWDGRE
jgi:N-acetylglutamate synthase-like GNAT family acetyltransferase